MTDQQATYDSWWQERPFSTEVDWVKVPKEVVHLELEFTYQFKIKEVGVNLNLSSTNGKA